MELHQVRYFLAVCEAKNFTRAAKCCGVSQPSLSNAIRKLEEELGGQLFHRNRANCLLSALGQEVRPHLARLDQCVRDAVTRARDATSAAAATSEPDSPIDTPPGYGSLAFIWGTQTGTEAQNNRRGHTMRKPIYAVGAFAFAVAATLVWSQHALVSSRANTVSELAAPAKPPMDISEMQRNSKALPEEAFEDMTFVFSNAE